MTANVEERGRIPVTAQTVRIRVGPMVRDWLGPFPSDIQNPVPYGSILCDQRALQSVGRMTRVAGLVCDPLILVMPCRESAACWGEQIVDKGLHDMTGRTRTELLHILRGSREGAQ